MRVFGVTVHYVDEGVDTGPIILQRGVELPHARSADEVFEQIPDAFALGVPSFKLFMDYRKRKIMWDGQPLMRALETIGRLGGTWCCHAENGDRGPSTASPRSACRASGTITR